MSFPNPGGGSGKQTLVIEAAVNGDGVTDNLPAIQTALTAANAAGGGTVYVPYNDSGQVMISSCPVIYSNTHLIIDDTVRIFLEPGLPANTQRNLIVNAALATTARGVVDAQMAVGSNIVSSATAAFTPADTGNPLQIWGPAYNYGALTGVMTYVDPTHVSLAGRTGTDGSATGTTHLTSTQALWTPADVGQTITEPGNVHIPAGTTIIGIAPSGSPETGGFAILSNTVAAGSGITFTLGCSAVNGPANQRTVTDGAIVAGPAGTLCILQSATAAFTANDTGKVVTVAGSGLAANTLMLYVNATTVSLSKTATTAVTNASTVIGTGTYACIGPRDSNIAITGGIWDQGALTGASALDYHDYMIRIRRCDGFRFSPHKLLSSSTTAGAYAISIGDVTDVEVATERDCYLNVCRDGLHVDGPASNIHVGTMRGFTGDDFLALGSGNYVTLLETVGPVSHIKADNLLLENAKSGVALFGNFNYWPISGVKIGTLAGTMNGEGFAIRAVADQQGLLATNVSGLSVDHVDITPNAIPVTAVQVIVSGANIQDMRIGDVVHNNNTFPFIQVSNGVIGTQQFVSRIGHLTIDGYRDTSGTFTGQILFVIGRIDEAQLNNVVIVTAPAGGARVLQTNGNGSVGDLKVNGLDFTSAGSNNSIVVFQPLGGASDGLALGGTNIFNSPSAQFTTADVGQTIAEAGNAHIPAGTTIASVNSPYQAVLSNTVAAGTGIIYTLARPLTIRIANGNWANNGFELFGTATIFLSNCTSNPQSWDIFLGATANVTLFASAVQQSTTHGVSLTAGALFRANGPMWRIDIVNSLSNPSGGDMVYNTNAAAPAGVGLVLYEAGTTSWKAL